MVPFSSATSTSLAGAGRRSVATCSGSASAGTAMALAQRFSERWGHQRCGQLQTRQACRGGIRFERGHTQPEAMEGSWQSGPSTQTLGGISKTGEKHSTMPMTTATTINKIFILHLLLMLSSSWQCYIFFYAPTSTGAALEKRGTFYASRPNRGWSVREIHSKAQIAPRKKAEFSHADQ